LVAAQGVLLDFCKSLIFAYNTDHGVNLPLISANKARSWPIWGSLFPQHEDGTSQQCEICGGVLRRASALIFKECGVAWMVVLIFHVPSKAHFAQDVSGRLCLATAR
jgi:hypothetical protein